MTSTCTAGHRTAQKLYAAEKCQSCGATSSDTKIDRHHVDGDTFNNSPTNIRILCVRCHMTEDGRRDALKVRIREIQKQASIKRRKWKGTGKVCLVEACSLPAVTRGWCNSHYVRARHNNWDPGTSPVAHRGVRR